MYGAERMGWILLYNITFSHKDLFKRVRERFALSKTKVWGWVSVVGDWKGMLGKTKTIQCSSDFNAPLTRHCSLGQKNEMRTFHI